MNKFILPWLKDLLKGIKLPEFLMWLKKSAEEHNGKTSGKRLSAAFFSALVAYVVIYEIHNPEKLTPTIADFLIWIVITLIGYIATVFGLSYIPKKSQKENDKSSV